VALAEIDRNLLQRCLARKPRAWEDFVDRFLGLVVHVINHTAQCRSLSISPQDREDLAAEVFLAIVSNDLAVLRRFRGESSLATYLTVVARRVVVRELLRRKTSSTLNDAANAVAHAADGSPPHEQRIDDREQVERLIGTLDDDEAQVVRLYHLDGLSYEQISSQVGIPQNSIGPTLSRARAKMRKAEADPATG
jgi:RNA polymerase sigma-70 factor (ECF subfamily)